MNASTLAPRATIPTPAPDPPTDNLCAFSRKGLGRDASQTSSRAGDQHGLLVTYSHSFLLVSTDELVRLTNLRNVGRKGKPRCSTGQSNGHSGTSTILPFRCPVLLASRAAAASVRG